MLASARAETEAFINIDYREAQASIDKVAAGATGEFKEQYTQSADSVIEVLEQNESVMDGEVAVGRRRQPRPGQRPGHRGHHGHGRQQGLRGRAGRPQLPGPARPRAGRRRMADQQPGVRRMRRRPTARVGTPTRLKPATQERRWDGAEWADDTREASEASRALRASEGGGGRGTGARHERGVTRPGDRGWGRTTTSTQGNHRAGRSHRGPGRRRAAGGRLPLGPAEGRADGVQRAPGAAQPGRRAQRCGHRRQGRRRLHRSARTRRTTSRWTTRRR